MGTKYNIKWFKGYKNMPEAYYRLKIPSVSKIVDQIPDPELEKFIKDVGEEKANQIMEAAAQRGTAMHLFIENFLNTFKESQDPSKALKYTQEKTPQQLQEQEIPENKIKIGRNLFYNYYHSDFCNANLKVIGTEVSFYSPKFFYRGFIDLLYKQNLKGISITDFKTSSSRISEGTTKNKKYKTQIALYTLGIEDLYQEKGKDIQINYGSILAMHTKRDIVQEVVCEGNELQEYKDYAKELVKQWHKENNQEFLFS